jgi:hypothetical protein
VARHDLIGTWLREGEWNCRVIVKGFLKDLERLIEEICCTAQGDLNFLERLLPSPFLVECLKTAVMFIHDRVLRLQHQTIDSGHRYLPFV